MERHVYLFSYAAHPYEEIRDLLRDDPERLLAPATEEAEKRRLELVASLGITIGKVEIARDVVLELGPFTETDKPWPIAKRTLRWRALHMPGAFPSMEADIEAYPLSSTETQVSFLGRYRPPLGPVGAMADSVALHRVADASLHRFFESLMEPLKNSQTPVAEPAATEPVADPALG